MYRGVGDLWSHVSVITGYTYFPLTLPQGRGYANDPTASNDPQIGPQIIPRPEMIPANGVAKNREWRGLYE